MFDAEPTVRAGTKLYVRLELELPCDADEVQILEWLRFAVGDGALPNTNPLGEYDVEGRIRSWSVQG